jgi:hypothetical protein
MDGSLTRRQKVEAAENNGLVAAGSGKPEAEQAALDDTPEQALALDGSLELAPAGSCTSEPAEAVRRALPRAAPAAIARHG